VRKITTVSVLFAAALLCALFTGTAYAEDAHGSIEVAGSEVTFHVTVPPKECEQGGIRLCNWYSWFADAYTDSVGDHCATPASEDIVAVSGEETGTEATFSANLAQLRDHIGPWDICLYAHGFGGSEGLLAEDPYVYPSPTGTITVIRHAPNALELPWMTAKAEVTEPYSGPPGWQWWWAVTALPAGTPCPATFAPHSYIGSSSVRESNAAIIPEYVTLYFTEASGAFALCLYVDIENAPEGGIRLVGGGSYTFPPPPTAPLPVVTPTVHTSIVPPPKAPTRAQKFAKVLKACKRKPRRKRAMCERQARKKYGKKR
jgi:hypothetical protein